MREISDFTNKIHSNTDRTYVCIGDEEISRLTGQDGAVPITALSTTLIDSLHMWENPSKFFNREEDLKHYFKADIREDLFYTLKRKTISKGYPARFLYVLDFLRDKKYSYNEIFRYLTEKQMSHVASALPDGVSLECIVRNHYDSSFKVLRVGDKLRREEYTEVRLPIREGRIAYIVNSIADRLSYEDIMDIELKNKRLMLKGKPVASLGGSKYGVCKGTYDLRRVL